jgi:hypothetical protein
MAMSSVRRITIWLVASVGLLLACVVPASAETEGRPFTVDLTGEAEVNAQGVPNQGDLDGTGTASLTINPGLGEVCWTIEVADVEPITAAHIHVAPSTAPGPMSTESWRWRSSRIPARTTSMFTTRPILREHCADSWRLPPDPVLSVQEIRTQRSV